MNLDVTLIPSFCTGSGLMCQQKDAWGWTEVLFVFLSIIFLLLFPCRILSV